MKPALLPAALALAFGTAIAVAQAPVVRQSPDQSQAPALQQQDSNTPPMGHAHHQHDPNKAAAKLAKELTSPQINRPK